jgi:hypothetical protein
MKPPRLIPSTEYAKIGNDERLTMEITSYNYARTFGGKMKIPPELFESLRLGGVNMKYMEACEDLRGKLPGVL